MHDIEHAVRQAGLFQQAREDQGRRRIAFRGFQDEGIAAGDGNGKHPHRHHAGKIEGRDAGDHAQGRVFAVGVHAGADVHRVLAFDQMRNAAGEFDHFQTPRQFALGIGEHLAVLMGDCQCDFIGMVFEQLLELEHDPCPRQRRGCRPGRKGLLCRGDGGFDIAFIRQRDPAGDRAAGRIEHFGAAGTVAENGIAVDEMGDGGGHGQRSDQAFSASAADT